MYYGDEFAVDSPAGWNVELPDTSSLDRLFENVAPLSQFHSSPDDSFIHELSKVSFTGLWSYKIDQDRMFEINNTYLRKQIVVKNQVADLISFQFVSTTKRSEFLGEQKNVHDLGPAVIVTAIPNAETTYRMPQIGVSIRNVVVYTTLSNLMERMGESVDNYPLWLQEILAGEHDQPRQRVMFLEDINRDLIWSCFNLPVTGALLNFWMSAKFHELLCIGLQILKDNQSFINHHPVTHALPHSEKIRKGRTILSQEYSHPPLLPALAQKLGMSETQLKSGFKSMYGTTILQYCITKRIEAAKLLLNENRHSISEIGDIVGYADHSAFSRAFRRLTGSSPQAWRQSGSSAVSAQK
jgi:AraC-like DNA-binding protein